MIKRSALLLFAFTSFLLHAQSPDYLSHIKLLDRYLMCYESVSPWGGNIYALEDCGISKDEVNQILKENAENFEPLSDSLEAHDMQYILQVFIAKQLKTILNHKDFETFPFETLLQSNSLEILSSADRKLWNLSYYENTGGTYHSRVSYMHYKGLSSKSLMPFERYENEFFHPDGYSSIQQFEEQGTVYYVLVGGAKTCGTCSAEYMNIVYFDGEKLISNFSTSFDFRIWNSDGYAINFDAKSKELKLRFVSNEKDLDCLETFMANLMAYEVYEESAIQCECRFLFREGELKPLECNSSEYVNEY